MDSSLLYNMHAHHSPFFFGSSLNLSSSPISISPLTTTSSSLPNDTDRYLYLTRHQNQHHGRDNIPLFPPPGLSLHHYGNEPDPKTGLFTSTTVDAAHLTTSTLYPGLNINSTDAITQAHLDRTSTTTTSMSGTYATIDPTVAGPPDTSYLAREDPDQRQLQWLYDSINALLPTVGDDALALQDAVESPVALGDDVFDVEACIDQMASGFVNIKVRALKSMIVHLFVFVVWPQYLIKLFAFYFSTTGREFVRGRIRLSQDCRSVPLGCNIRRRRRILDRGDC